MSTKESELQAADSSQRKNAAAAPNEYQYEEAFEQTGHGRFNYLATTCACLIFIHSIFEMVAFAYVITPAECDLYMTVAQNSAVGSSVFIGIMLTAILWGLLGDLYGRKKIMLPAVLSAILTSFISSMCTGFWSMFIMRFLTGIAVSASSAMVLVYLAELQTASYRDRHVSIVIASTQFSFFFLTGAAWILIPSTWVISIGSFRIRSWRVFMWLWGIVGIIGAAILIFLPESPRYIIAVKGANEALPILAKIYAWNHSSSATEYPVKSIDMTSVPHHEVNLRKDLRELIKVPMRKCVFLTHGAMFITFLLNNGFYIWHTDMLNAALKFFNKPWSLCQLIWVRYGKDQSKLDDSELISEVHVHPVLELAFNGAMESSLMPFAGGNSSTDKCQKGHINTMVYPYTLVVEILYFGPFVAVVLLIKKFKKVYLYAFFMVFCSMGLILCSFVPQMIASFCFLALGLCCGSCCSILTAMVVEAFPTSLRGLTTCTMYMVGQLGAVVGTSVLSLMIGWGCHFIFVIMAAGCTGSAVALIFLWGDPLKVRRIMESRGFTY